MLMAFSSVFDSTALDADAVALVIDIGKEASESAKKNEMKKKKNRTY